MGKITIDYRNTDAKQKVCDFLDKWIASPKKEKLEIQLEHVVSGDFEEDFDIGDVTDSMAGSAIGGIIWNTKTILSISSEKPGMGEF